MSDGRWLRRNWLFLIAILVGSGLRLYQIKTQIIIDDEWHAIHIARDLDFFSIASHFGDADVSIPIALFYRLVITTFGLSEWIMRAPVLFFGLLSVVVFPLIVRRFFGPMTSVLFAWLLAISPIHVYYSRFARPYSIALFFGFCGVSAFHLWWTTRNPRWKWVYGLCAIVGPYFSLSVLPVTCAPLALAFARAIWKRNRDHEFFGELVRLSLFVGGALTVLLLPPIYGDFSALARKTGQGTLTSSTAIGALELLLGMRDVRWVQAVSLALMILGTFFLGRRQPRLALLLGASACAAILTIIVSRPEGIQYPIVAARYAIFLLPILLLALAIGLRTIGYFVTGSEQYAALIIGIGWVVVVAHSGPFQQIYYAPNNFTTHGVFQYYPSLDSERNAFVKSFSHPVSAYYGQLSQQPRGRMRIVEAPWYYEWDYNPFPVYQLVHHQYVEIGFVTSEADPPGEVSAFDRRFRFHNFVHLQDMNSLCAHKIDRLVLHKNLEKEIGRTPGRDFSGELPMLIAQYQDAYGPPIFEDDWLIVFSTTAQCLAQHNQGKFAQSNPLIVTGFTLDTTAITAGSSYFATVDGPNLMATTYFDIRVSPPGSSMPIIADNWQTGPTMQHSVALGTAKGTWTVTGVRAHSEPDNHAGNFVTVSAALTVREPSLAR